MSRSCSPRMSFSLLLNDRGIRTLDAITSKDQNDLDFLIRISILPFRSSRSPLPALSPHDPPSISGQRDPVKPRPVDPDVFACVPLFFCQNLKHHHRNIHTLQRMLAFCTDVGSNSPTLGQGPQGPLAARITRRFSLILLSSPRYPDSFRARHPRLNKGDDEDQSKGGFIR